MGYRLRLRDLPDMDSTYVEPHDHRRFGHGHHLRVEQTKAVVRWLAEWKRIATAADLSCGNGEIVRAAGFAFGDPYILGDYAPGYEFQGPIEETIEQIPVVDLFVCCETLEHLDDPGGVLQRIHAKSDFLVLSTPVNNFRDPNAEHLWEWNRGGVEDLLADTGWSILHFSESDTRPLDGVYRYGIWALEAA